MNIARQRTAVAALFLVAATTTGHLYAAPEAAELPVAVAADDPHLAYVGRWDTSDPSGGPRCAWSASAVTIRFHGTAAGVTLKDAGKNDFQIVVDGKPTQVLHPGNDVSTHPIAGDLPDGDHTVQVFRRTEASQGPTQVRGFRLSAGAKLLDPVKPRRRIEVIGDSISCGYGNEGKSQNEHFKPSTENAWLTYGAIAARHFDAAYACVAWSGRKMWPDNTVPSIYDLVIPTEGKNKCDFAKLPKPDVVVINLATNDFGNGNPDEAGWTGAYTDFARRLRDLYPDAMIYVATGSMMSDNWPPKQKALTTVKSYLAKVVANRNAAGDKKIAAIDFAPQDQKNGLGSDWHPSVKTHEIMAETLQAAIAKDLAWKAEDDRK